MPLPLNRASLRSRFPRLLESLGKSWISFDEIYKPWKVLDNGFGPGNFSERSSEVVEYF